MIVKTVKKFDDKCNEEKKISKPSCFMNETGGFCLFVKVMKDGRFIITWGFTGDSETRGGFSALGENGFGFSLVRGVRLGLLRECLKSTRFV